MRTSIYFDNNATTQLEPSVASWMSELQGRCLGNPASQHAAGRRALAILEESKTTLLQQLGARWSGMDSAQVILTSGGTESNNLALYALSRARPGCVIVGATEHPSIAEAAASRHLCPKPVRILPVDQHGQHDVGLLEEWLQGEQPIALVSVMLGNNETGIIGNLAELSRLCASHGVPLHSDVVQAAGKLPVDMSQLELAAVSISGHKFHGPVGIGALLVSDSPAWEPLFVGGGQQLAIRPGTEPVIAAAGLAKALCLANAAVQAGIYDQLARLRDRFESALRSLPETVIIGDSSPRLPTTSNVAFVGLDRQALAMALDLGGIACSTGSACASGSARPSPVLLAMGLPESIVNSSIRFSFSKFTSSDDVDQAIQIIQRVVGRLRAARSRPTPCCDV